MPLVHLEMFQKAWKIEESNRKSKEESRQYRLQQWISQNTAEIYSSSHYSEKSIANAE